MPNRNFRELEAAMDEKQIAESNARARQMAEEIYPAIIQRDPEGGDYVVTFPDLEGAITGGATLEEAFAGASDCLASWLAFARAEGRPVPLPSRLQDGQFAIAPLVL